MSEQGTMMRSETFTMNLGPQHPSTHGVYRAICEMDGETVVHLTNEIGYLHRGMEKLAESRTYTQFIPYTDRLDYLGPILCEWGYCMTVEKLLQVEVPERAEYMRVILGELQRIASHLVYLASLALDLNGYTVWMYMFRERERILDLIEMYAGSRMTACAIRIGGMPSEFPPGFVEKLTAWLDHFPSCFREYEHAFIGNEIFHARVKNVGIIDAAMCRDYGIGGINLRAAGEARDLRKDAPYSVYDRFTFAVPTGAQGDCYDRFMVRYEEMRESLSIIRQALEQMPAEGDIMAKIPKIIKPAPGEAYCQIEAAKGWQGYHIVSDGTTKPHRLRIHSPSLMALGAFAKAAEGLLLQDVIALLASIDIVLGDVDR